MRDHGLQPSTLISPISDKIYVGHTKEGADTSSSYSNGVASKIQTYVKRMRERGLGFMCYADTTVYYMQDGDSSNKKRYDALLQKTGANAKFVASSVDPSLVGIGRLEIGAAANSGRISILMPVRCSELGGWVRARYVISRSLVDTHVQPSDELCAGALAAAKTMAAAQKNLATVYRETGLVYNTNHPNGHRAIIVGDYNGRDAKSIKKLRGNLREGLKHGPAMAEAAEKVLGEVAGDVSIEDIHEAAKAAGSPSVKPNATFDSTFRAAFDQFLGAVGKKLHKIGCMGSTKGKKGKRAVDESGASLGTGGKGSGKRGAKKKKKSPYPRGPGQPGQAENALFR